MVKKQFNEQIHKTATCWLWTGRKDKDGYGKYRVTAKEEIRAHRFMWEKTHGPIPEGMLVCHTCDNSSCVNPDHLWLATPQGNMTDKVKKGRQRSGRAPGRTWSKLTEATVAEIHAACGQTQMELAHKYGVSQQLISRVLLGEVW